MSRRSNATAPEHTQKAPPTGKWLGALSVTRECTLGCADLLSTRPAYPPRPTTFDVVSWSEGDRVRVVEGAQQVVIIREIPYQGDPERALVEPVDDAPGSYPWPTPVRFLVPE